MAALHIIPLNGTQVPPKVLALIRERAFKMEVGQIATHGFASDGYDVYLRKMGGAIQAIVQGDSAPYMLAFKIECLGNSRGTWFEVGLARSDVAPPPDPTSDNGPIHDSWYPAEYVATPESPYKTYLPLVDGEYSVGEVYDRKEPPYCYWAVASCEKPTPETYPLSQKLPVLQNFYVGIGNKYSDCIRAAVITARFGKETLLSRLPKDQQTLSFGVRAYSYSVASGWHTPPLKLTAEWWDKPKQEPDSFYPHVANSPWYATPGEFIQMDLPVGDRAPTIDPQKTKTAYTIGGTVYTELSASFSYNHATGEISINV